MESALSVLQGYDFSDVLSEMDEFETMISESFPDAFSTATDDFQTMLEGYVAFNQALDSSYLPTGEAVLEMAGVDSSSWGTVSAAIDTLNAAVSSEENGIVDFSASLVAMGAAFQELNTGLADGTITADQYSSVLGSVIDLYGDSVDAIEDHQEEFQDMLDTIQDAIYEVQYGSSTSDSSSLESAQSYFAEVYSAVMSGDTDSAGDLSTAASEYLSALSDYAPTTYEYEKGQSYILRSLEAAEDYAEDQVSETEELLIIAEDQVVILEGLSDTTTESLSTLYSVDGTISDLNDHITSLEWDFTSEDTMTGLFSDYLGDGSELATLLTGLTTEVESLEDSLSSISVTVNVSTAAESVSETSTSTSDDADDNSDALEYLNDLVGVTTYGDDWTATTGTYGGLSWDFGESAGYLNWKWWYGAATDTEWQNFADRMDMTVEEAMGVVETALDTAEGIYGYAEGGIASGPASGYLAELHDTELIVPLNNLKNTRVNSGQDYSELVERVRALESLLEKLLTQNASGLVRLISFLQRKETPGGAAWNMTEYA